MTTPLPSDGEHLLATVQSLAPQLRAAGAAAESDRQLPQPVVQLLQDADLFRLFVPRALGGRELDPLTVAAVVEELANAESAAAWCVLVANQLSWDSGFLPAAVAQTIFGDPGCIVAGQFYPAGQAVAVPGGY